MDWSTYGTWVAQIVLAFMLLSGCYGAARGQMRRERLKDMEALYPLRSEDVTPEQDPATATEANRPAGPKAGPSWPPLGKP